MLVSKVMLIYEIIFVYATRQVIKKYHKLGNTAILLQKGVKKVQNSTKNVIGRGGYQHNKA